MAARVLDFDERSARGTKADRAALKRKARGGDELLDDVYRQGVKEGRAAARRRRRPPARRRRRSGPTAKAVRQLRAPLEAQAVSGLRAAGLTLGVVGLYLVLTNAEDFAGFIGGAGKGLRWLSDPTRSIPYSGGR